jgi:hypothetical protein
MKQSELPLKKIQHCTAMTFVPLLEPRPRVAKVTPIKACPLMAAMAVVGYSGEATFSIGELPLSQMR